jgi:hypothetical protein
MPTPRSPRSIWFSTIAVIALCAAANCCALGATTWLPQAISLIAGTVAALQLVSDLAKRDLGPQSRVGVSACGTLMVVGWLAAIGGLGVSCESVAAMGFNLIAVGEGIACAGDVRRSIVRLRQHLLAMGNRAAQFRAEIPRRMRGPASLSDILLTVDAPVCALFAILAQPLLANLTAEHAFLHELVFLAIGASAAITLAENFARNFARRSCRPRISVCIVLAALGGLLAISGIGFAGERLTILGLNITTIGQGIRCLIEARRSGHRLWRALRHGEQTQSRH